MQITLWLIRETELARLYTMTAHEATATQRADALGLSLDLWSLEEIEK